MLENVHFLPLLSITDGEAECPTELGYQHIKKDRNSKWQKCIS